MCENRHQLLREVLRRHVCFNQTSVIWQVISYWQTCCWRIWRRPAVMEETHVLSPSPPPSMTLRTPRGKEVRNISPLTVWVWRHRAWVQRLHTDARFDNLMHILTLTLSYSNYSTNGIVHIKLFLVRGQWRTRTCMYIANMPGTCRILSLIGCGWTAWVTVKFPLQSFQLQFCI